MLFLPILNLFLYFPEDKSEYIPAVIKLVICIMIAIFVFRLIIKHSKKEQAKAEELEKKLMNQDKDHSLK
ncbi:hypothetical protein E1I69_19915 [Bacillus timonensis]|uniref:Uncharacterized protein n=1 Tax=Bacillus timonensis TaxID=1033734 RepID=A0A4S3PKZ9_9BACI|nr:hypothetical protein [Bacillus timonensis]THE10147.1 hypothetical protein E1I69_19915 [Bacillus timonensis]